MKTEAIILSEAFCDYHHVEFTFIETLYNLGLIKLTSDEEKKFIHEEELSKLEQLIRLHQDLQINPEGLNAIFHLQEKIKMMQQEITFLKYRLSYYEFE